MGWFLDLLLPPRCEGCGIETLQASALCSECWGKIHFLSTPQCEICGYPFEVSEMAGKYCGSCLRQRPLYECLRSACRYDEACKPLLMRFKHGDATYLTPLFVSWLGRVGAALIQESDYILPVPLHWRRLVRRGYNQAALLAQGLSRQFCKSYVPYGLRRHRFTPSQGKKSVIQRRQNVAGAFYIASSCQRVIEGKRILLVDDVYTSGATIKECVKVLRTAYPSNIKVLTLARVILPEKL